MVYPRPLRRGGKIGICAPAGPVAEDRLRVAVAAIQSEGFDVETTSSAFEKHGLFSAPDEIRQREIESLFAREDIGAVLTARGGVGTSRLLPILDTAGMARSRKPFLSFSDLTALQWTLFTRHRFVTFAGPLAVEWDGAISEVSRRQAWRVLCGESEGDLWGDFPRQSLKVMRGPGRASGFLMPGNLSMITTLLGTPFMPDLKDAVLMIEDVNEPPHRVDRMLFHLRNAGVLQELNGLLVGDFGTDTDPLRGEALSESLLDATRGTNYPVISGFPFGHGPERMTLPVGAPVKLDLKRTEFTMQVPVKEAV